MNQRNLKKYIEDAFEKAEREPYILLITEGFTEEEWRTLTSAFIAEALKRKTYDPSINYSVYSNANRIELRCQKREKNEELDPTLPQLRESSLNPAQQKEFLNLHRPDGSHLINPQTDPRE